MRYVWRWESLNEGQASLQHSTNQASTVEWPDRRHDSLLGAKKTLKDSQTMTGRILWSEIKTELFGITVGISNQYREKMYAMKWRAILSVNLLYGAQDLRVEQQVTSQQDNDLNHTAKRTWEKPRVASELYEILWMSWSGPARVCTWTQYSISGETWKWLCPFNLFDLKQKR